MDDHAADAFFPADSAPTLAPCVYVNVTNPNPLPSDSWDEESVSTYDYFEWLEVDSAVSELTEIIKPNQVVLENEEEDETEHTVDTDDDDDQSKRTEPLTELIIYRCRSTNQLSVSPHRDLVRSSSMTELHRTVVSSAFSSFLQDRLYTLSSNIEFLTKFKNFAEKMAVANHATVLEEKEEAVDEEGEAHNKTRVARVNPLAQFLQARINTFQANIEILPLLLAEQVEACLHLGPSTQ